MDANHTKSRQNNTANSEWALLIQQLDQNNCPRDFFSYNECGDISLRYNNQSPLKTLSLHQSYTQTIKDYLFSADLNTIKIELLYYVYPKHADQFHHLINAICIIISWTSHLTLRIIDTGHLDGWDEKSDLVRNTFIMLATMFPSHMKLNIQVEFFFDWETSGAYKLFWSCVYKPLWTFIRSVVYQDSGHSEVAAGRQAMVGLLWKELLAMPAVDEVQGKHFFYSKGTPKTLPYGYVKMSRDAKQFRLYLESWDLAVSCELPKGPTFTMPAQQEFPFGRINSEMMLWKQGCTACGKLQGMGGALLRACPSCFLAKYCSRRCEMMDVRHKNLWNLLKSIRYEEQAGQG